MLFFATSLWSILHKVQGYVYLAAFLHVFKKFSDEPIKTPDKSSFMYCKLHYLYNVPLCNAATVL